MLQRKIPLTDRDQTVSHEGNSLTRQVETEGSRRHEKQSIRRNRSHGDCSECNAD